MTNLFTCFSSAKVCQGSPKGLRLLLALFMVFCLGVGNVWGAEGDANYTLYFSKLSTSGSGNGNNSSYGTAHTTVSGWSLTGNQTIGKFLAVGGKDNSATDRVSYSTSGIGTKTIGKVRIATEGTGGTGTITFSKLKLEVSSHSDFAVGHIIDTQTNNSPNSNGNNDFTPTAPLTSWPAGSYYRITYTYKNSQKSDNGYFKVNSVTFYEGASGGGDCTSITPALSYSTDSIAIGGTSSSPTLTGNTGSGTVSYASSNTSVATVNSSTGVVTGVATGDVTITASVGASGSYCSGSATATVKVRRGISYYIGSTSYTVGGVDGNKLTSTLPLGPTSCDTDHYPYFYGWKNSSISGSTTTPPTILSTETVSSSSAANTYYAVFSDWFQWSGGVKAGLTALPGVTASGLGADYGESHAQYRVKLDDTGDNIIITTIAQPSKVSIGVKMIGGATTSSIKVQESSAVDGTFTDVQSLSISGKQNDILNLETSNSFKSTTRAIKLYFTKSSNVGLGPITIEGSSDANYVSNCITILGTIDGSLSMTSSTDGTVTISGWTYSAGSTGTTESNVSSYTVKLYKYNSITSSWALANANTTTGGSSGSEATRTGIATDSKSVTFSGLEYGETYKFTVQAIGDGSSYASGTETAVTSINSNALTDNKFLNKYSIYIDDGTNDNYAHNYISSISSHAGSVDLFLNGSIDYYQYQLTLGGVIWWGNTGKMTSANCSGWTFTKDAANCQLQTSMAGTYTFALAASTPAITVTYPSDDQTSGYKIYFDNSVLDWSNLYYRIGKTDHNQNSELTAVTGTDNFYYATTPNYDNIAAWHIANNTGWSGSNSIYLTNTSDSYAITNAISFQQYVVTGDITIVPTTTHSKGGDSQNSNCDFYTTNTPTSGMLTHTATVTEPTNGTITLSYTSKSGSPSTETVSGLPHRTNLVITTTPATGYNRNTLTVNSSNFTSGNTHILSADATIAATFSAKTYSITLDREGASTGSTSVTMTYDSDSHTSITAPTKAGFEFGGWWSGDDGTGSMVMDASGVLQANVDGFTGAGGIWTKDATCTLYAKWDPQKTFVPATSSTTLEEGDEIIFYGSSNFMSKTQNGNNRGITTSGYTASGSNYLIPSSTTVQIVKLEATETEGKWLFKVTTDSCLYAVSSSNNYLRTTTKAKAGANGEWTISVDGSNNATITAQGDNSHNLIKYNTSKVFACYDPDATVSGTSLPKLYYYRRSDPYITTNPTSFSTFTYAIGYGPSLAQALTIKGYNLTGNLTVSCPTGYELSSSSAVSGFGTSNLTLTKDANNKVNTTVYIRLAAGKSIDSYNQTMTISGGGITSTSFSLTGSVVAVPASSTLYCLVTRAADIFPDDEIVILNSSGDRLLSPESSNKDKTNRIAAHATTNFTQLGRAVFVNNSSDSIQNIAIEGCDDEWLFYVGNVSENKTYFYSAGATSNNYLKAAEIGTAGNNGKWTISIDNDLCATIKSNGTSTHNWLCFNGNNNPNLFSCYASIPTGGQLPKIYAKPSATANVCGSPSALSGFETTYGTASSAQTISVKARNISTGAVTVTAPSGYEVCLTENGSYTSSVTITPTDGAVSATTVYVRLSASSDKGTYESNLTISATSATTRNVSLSGEITCADPELEFAGDVTVDGELEMTLSGSSVTSDKVVFSSLSSGSYTISVVDDSDNPTTDLQLNTTTKKFTATAIGMYTVTLSQAASGNYCAGDEIEFTVAVYCGTPDAPTGLDVSESNTQATISWDAVDGADHYDVIVSGKTSGGDESYYESFENITSTSTIVTGLKAGCTYEYIVTVTNTCGQTEDSDDDEFTTLPYSVTYHSATETDYALDVISGESVSAHSTDDCDNGKVFVGWTTSAVAALQQSDPTTNTTGAIASVTANTDLYAVFASQNGYTTATILNEKWNVVEWDGTNKIVGGSYSSWATNFADAPSTSFKISGTSYQAIVFDVSSARTITSESAYSNLKAIQITGSNRSSFAMNVTVKVSANKSDWTTVDTKSLSSSSNSTPETLVFTLSTKGDYYVRIETQAKSSGNKTGITNIRLYQEQDYYLTDYSTTCTKASSPAAITWENGSGTLAEGTQPASATIGSDITMPTLTKADYRFDGWKATINSEDKTEVFTGGDKFKVNHPVTFTAQWTQVFSVSSPTDGLTSYKDIQVTSTSQTFTTVGMHNAVPSIMVADDTYFSATINSHEANSSDEDYSYTFTYQPNAFGTGSGAATNTTTATVTDARTGVVSSPITLRGRSLPEEFVIAIKKDNQWVALPNNLASTSAQPSIVPLTITVNDADIPTAAVYAPATTIYKAMNRGDNAHNTAIRFTTTESNYLQVSGSDYYNMWLSTSKSANVQDWQLKSSNFNSYELTIPSNSATKKMGIYNSTYMGYHGSPNNSAIYLLPVTNTYTEIAATVHEWGEHGVIIQPTTPSDLSSVKSATMNVGTADPTVATATAVNVAMGTAKYVRVYAAGVTVGGVANEGKQLYVHWKNEGGSEIGVSQVTIPCVVATSNDMHSIASTKGAWSSKSEVHVLPGVTLEANAGSFSGDGALSVSKMEIYPGATLKVSTGTFNATTLRLRCGWTRAGDKKYDVARVFIADDAALTKTTASMDYDIYEKSDGKHYYPLAVPFKTQVSTIDYADEALASASIYGKHIGIDKYDGASRATSGATDGNWVQMTTDEYLEPGKGYTMTAVSSKGSAIIRVPLVFDNGWTADGEKATIDESYYKNQVSVTAYSGAASTGGGANNRNAGWNMLGVPYMSCFDASDASADPSDAFIKGMLNFLTGEYTESANVYVNVPVHDFSEYIQKPVSEAKLLPGWSFFVQIGKNGTLSFATAGQEPSSTLPIYAPQREDMPVVKTGIVLSRGDKSDNTTLLISDKYSANEYEINADLEKMFGNGYTLATYSLSQNTRLAYNAMSTTDARQVIPIGFRAPEDGEYTFSMNPRYADAAVERVDLIDYQTGEVTNLMMSEYTFTTVRTQDDERFALNVVPRAEVPTGVDDNSQKSKVESRKLIIDDHVFIIHDGLLYDATGKRVTEINK